LNRKQYKVSLHSVRYYLEYISCIKQSWKGEFGSSTYGEKVDGSEKVWN